MIKDNLQNCELYFGAHKNFEKAFDFIDQQIKAVAWEKYDILRECFGVLEKI